MNRYGLTPEEVEHDTRNREAAAKAVRLKVYVGETLEIMTADLISYCKAQKITKADAIAAFSEIWERVQRTDADVLAELERTAPTPELNDTTLAEAGHKVRSATVPTTHELKEGWFSAEIDPALIKSPLPYKRK